MSASRGIPRPAGSALDQCLTDYTYRPPLGGREPFCAADSLRAALRGGDGTKGQPRGVWARQALELEARERRELRAAKPGLVVDTELRDFLRKTTSYADRLRGRAALLRTAQRLPGMRGHRIGQCLQRMSRRGPTDPADGQRTVEVVAQCDYQGPAAYTELTGAPRYRGITVCGRGWVCPVCAAKITERRRRELRRGCARWRAAGGEVLLLTLTYPHGPMDDLGTAWERLGAAYQRFGRSPTVKRFRRSIRWAGRTRSREVTYGRNGWHPHVHALEFVAARWDDELIAGWREALALEWRRCCEAAGLEAPSLDHGCTLVRGDVDDYIAKWGLDAELTKWHAKREAPDPDAGGEPALHGYSPFDLLRIAAGELEADHPRLNITRERAGVLFTRYAEAVHGTAQLHWTRGLKAKLALAELIGDAAPLPAEAPLLAGAPHGALELDAPTDAEAAEAAELEQNETVLGALRAEDWFVISQTRRQVEFLGLVAALGFAGARAFVPQWRRELEAWRAKRLAYERRRRGIQWLWRGG